MSACAEKDLEGNNRMALAEFARLTQYVVQECYKEGCNCLFAMTLDMNNRRRADHKSFYCPNGHSQCYQGETEVAKLKRQLGDANSTVEWQRANRLRAERQAAAARGQVTKIKKRVGNGVCPCCNRTFSNMARHMQMQHPDFKKAEA